MAFAKQPAKLRQRNPNRSRKHEPGQYPASAVDRRASKDECLLDRAKPGPFSEPKDQTIARMSNVLRRQPVWLLLAVASGGCAAFNGVFAKLTTTSLTTSWSHAVAQALSLSPNNTIAEYVIRAAFFGLNLLFNIAMWSLFTAALTRASSTTRVSIINVSTNFFVTALLGLVIFGERLPPMWWAGAGLLAVGNVVIGRREENEKPGGTAGSDGSDEEGQVLLGEGLGGSDAGILLDGELAGEEVTKEAVQKGEDVDDPI